MEVGEEKTDAQRRMEAESRGGEGGVRRWL